MPITELIETKKTTYQWNQLSIISQRMNDKRKANNKAQRLPKKTEK